MFTNVGKLTNYTYYIYNNAFFYSEYIGMYSIRTIQLLKTFST